VVFADAWPLKPDVLFEGRNIVRNGNGENSETRKGFSEVYARRRSPQDHAPGDSVVGWGRLGMVDRLAPTSRPFVRP
jgi:hypothetical protein